MWCAKTNSKGIKSLRFGLKPTHQPHPSTGIVSQLQSGLANSSTRCHPTKIMVNRRFLLIFISSLELGAQRSWWSANQIQSNCNNTTKYSRLSLSARPSLCSGIYARDLTISGSQYTFLLHCANGKSISSPTKRQLKALLDLQWFQHLNHPARAMPPKVAEMVLHLQLFSVSRNSIRSSYIETRWELLDIFQFSGRWWCLDRCTADWTVIKLLIRMLRHIPVVRKTQHIALCNWSRKHIWCATRLNQDWNKTGCKLGSWRKTDLNSYLRPQNAQRSIFDEIRRPWNTVLAIAQTCPNDTDATCR